MAIAKMARAATEAVQAAAPEIKNMALAAVKSATSGRVTSLKGITGYVGGSADRMTVVGDALVRSGVKPDFVTPELIKSSAAVAKLAEALTATSAAAAQQSDATAQFQGSPATDAAVMLRLRRAKLALVQFGSAEAYSTLVPDGIPAADFVLLEGVRRTLRE